jgi:type II secretory pathway pseudopilin PulG
MLAALKKKNTYEVAFSSAELGLVVGVVDVVVIVIGVVAAGLVLATVGGSQAEETKESVTEGVASESLELLEVRLLGDDSGEENLALLGLVLFPATFEVLEIDHSCS